MHILRPLAEKGSAEAQVRVAEMYYVGDGVPRNFVQAQMWAQRAADLGNPCAKYLLGKMCDAGNGLHKGKDRVESLYAEAFRDLHPLAEKDDSLAQLSFGRMYYYGDGVREDHDQALLWLHRAAAWGEVRAQQLLGEIYYDRINIHPDEEETDDQKIKERYAALSNRWTRKAAEQGDPAAQFDLGKRYEHGHAGEKSLDKALQWYRMAADQGHIDAQLHLAASDKTNLTGRMCVYH